MGGILSFLFGDKGKENIKPSTVGQYQVSVKRKIGEGGFSVIYLVEARREGKSFVCVLKRLSCASEDRLKFAQTEVKLLKSMNHPNIIKLIDSSQQNGKEGTEINMLLPFYERGTLEDVSKKGEISSEPEIVSILIELCDALTQLHNQNPPVAHRDIKPGNVLISREGKGVLMDFGSCGLARPDTSTYAACQTLQDSAAELCSQLYRAPELYEVMDGSLVDERSDTWSLGCTAYYMLFHYNPFEYCLKGGGSIKLAVMSGKFDIPPHSYSDELITIIRNMLQVDVSKRPFVNQVKLMLEKKEGVKAGQSTNNLGESIVKMEEENWADFGENDALIAHTNV